MKMGERMQLAKQPDPNTIARAENRAGVTMARAADGLRAPHGTGALHG